MVTDVSEVKLLYIFGKTKMNKKNVTWKIIDTDIAQMSILIQHNSELKSI